MSQNGSYSYFDIMRKKVKKQSCQSSSITRPCLNQRLQIYEKVTGILKVCRSILSNLNEDPVLNANEKVPQHASALKLKKMRKFCGWFSSKSTTIVDISKEILALSISKTTEKDLTFQINYSKQFWYFSKYFPGNFNRNIETSTFHRLIETALFESN